MMICHIIHPENYGFLERKNQYLFLVDNTNPKSRLLLNKEIIKKSKKPQANKNNKTIKKEKSLNDKSLKQYYEKKNRDNKKKVQLILNFPAEKNQPLEYELKKFIRDIGFFDLNDSIIIRGYAEKKSGDSTSNVRRLSLKRALFVRAVLKDYNFNLSKVYVKALGSDNKIKGSKDVVIVVQN